MAIKAVVYDINQTLLEVGPRPTTSKVCAMLGISSRQFSEAQSMNDRDLSREFELGLSEQDRMRLILTNLGIPADADLIDSLVRADRQETIDRARVYYGAKETLSKVRALGLKQGLCSNGNPYGRAIAMEFGLLAATDQAVFSFEVGAMKPDNRMYRTICARLQVRLSEIVYVGDGGSNELQGAKRLGMITVKVPVVNPDRSQASMFAVDYYIKSISRLPALLISLSAKR